MEVMFHIGLAKAGSTYLQRWYAQHPDIVQFQDLFPIIKKGQWQLENDPKLTVLSDERFSSWIKHTAGWVKNIDLSFDARAYQRQTRDYLYALQPNAQILIVTRAATPGLLKSIYSQYVKTGGTCTFNDFFDVAADTIAKAFDYEHMVELYGEKFGRDRILALPLELMRDDPERFFSIIEQRFDLQRWRLPPQKINVSVNEEEMLFYPHLNRPVTGLFKAMLGNRGYRVLLLYIKLLSSGLISPLAKLYGLTHRRALKQQFKDMDTYLQRIMPSSQTVPLDDVFADYRALYGVKDKEIKSA